MKNTLKILFFFLAIILSSVSHAGWQTIETKIDKVLTYLDRDYILIRPANQSFPMPEACNRTDIAISTSVPVERRQQALSVLLSAQAQNKTVKLVISDNDCVPWTSGGVLYLRLIKIVS